MPYHSLRACLLDLEKKSELLKIPFETDPNLEMASIHRRIYSKNGPAILFEKVSGSPFEACSNVFGTHARSEYIFRAVLKKMEHLIKIKLDPAEIIKSPLKSLSTLPFALNGLPRKSWGKPEILKNETSILKLPLIKSWPMDGGAFVTLPQVISFPPQSKDVKQANVGMYRIQLNGNDYLSDQEVGLHYQIHRGIGIHHQAYNHSQEEFKVSVGIGGPPSHTLASIFPLPESLSELLFTGILGDRAYRYSWEEDYFIPSDVDFCITGTVVKNELKSEGPFGDHLGYYSLGHPFPYLKVHKVYHSPYPLWHFTVVGRPPQEDSSFGHLIHQMVRELTPDEFKGVKEIHAVDAAGVHPLLLAIGSERYMPFRDIRPEEILTQAMHILGKGQTSLAKYLMITTNEENQNLSTKNIPAYFDYVLRRIDFKRDLHFITNTTIDTLDYSGDFLNQGSKLIMAAHGSPIRSLSTQIPSALEELTEFKNIKIALPGILLCEMSSYTNQENEFKNLTALENKLSAYDWNGVAMIVLVDDAGWTSQNLNNFLWVTFTRSNPANDIFGVRSFTKNKHWGCDGPLIIDARKKPQHAPELIEDPQVEEKVDQLFKKHAYLSPYL
ncbi:MAG: UbiD family decarboxylase [Saprospiraceae bacterium]|nr:UbiD family decarboxylase [Saprospiraceae bacterium]